MANEQRQQLQMQLSPYPYLFEFLNMDFIEEQCRKGLKNYILRHLSDSGLKERIEKHLPILEKRLNELANLNGYWRLHRLLQGASTWDEYQELLAQLDITLWFGQNGLKIKEIEPSLPHRTGNGDLLISFLGNAVYCEIHSPQSIAKSIKLREGDNVDEKEKTKRILRVLLKKTKHQLPPEYPGILGIDTSKSAIFHLDVRDLAEKLFPQRPQITLIALWSIEGEGIPSWDMKPTSFIVNSRSKFRKIGENLLSYLRLTGEII